MKNSTKKFITYKIADELIIRSETPLVKLIGTRFIGRDCYIDSVKHNFKSGRIFWTYRICICGINFEKSVHINIDFTEEQMDKYFTCYRVMKIKRDLKLSLLV